MLDLLIYLFFCGFFYRKLQMMKEDGFVFPENQQTVPPGSDMKRIDVEKPDLSGLEPDQDELEFQPVSQSNNNFVIGGMEGLPNWSYYQ